MDRKEICLIVKAIAAGMVTTCQTMEAESKADDEQ
jgi:hypothetical protein